MSERVQEGAFQDFSNKQLEQVFGGSGPFLETAPGKTQFLKYAGTFDYEGTPVKESKYKPTKVNTGPDYAVKSDFPKGPGGSDVPFWLWKDGNQEDVVKALSKTSEEEQVPREWVKPINTLKYTDLAGPGTNVQTLINNFLLDREQEKERVLHQAMLERGVSPEEAMRRTMENRAEQAKMDVERGKRLDERMRAEWLSQFAPTIKARAEAEAAYDQQIAAQRALEHNAEQARQAGERRRHREGLPHIPRTLAEEIQTGNVFKRGERHAREMVGAPPPVPAGAMLVGGAAGAHGHVHRNAVPAVTGGGRAQAAAVEAAIHGEGDAENPTGVHRSNAGRPSYDRKGMPTKFQSSKYVLEKNLMTREDLSKQTADTLYEFLKQRGLENEALNMPKK